MAEKIFTCGVCGKAITLKEKDSRFTQVRYRTIAPEGVWESEWKTLCEECFEKFQKWMDGKGGDMDGS